MSTAFFEQIKQGLIVSCQTGNNPEFEDPSLMAPFAAAAALGGARAIRSEGLAEIKAIQSAVNLPVIGLLKGKFEDGSVRITRRMAEVEALVSLGVQVVAVDATARVWEGLTGPQLIRQIKDRYKIVVMADIARYEEGLEALEQGADCLSTTLSGYTPETLGLRSAGPDTILLKKLLVRVAAPIVAEGRYNSPEAAKLAIELGAWAVVVGTAITRPSVSTSWFADAIALGRTSTT